jgi:cell division protein FtsB
VRLVPALKTFLLCLLIGGSAAGYVLQKNTIYELGKQIREKEAVLERLKWENRIRANQLADLQSPTKIAERVRKKKMGLTMAQPWQVIWLNEHGVQVVGTNMTADPQLLVSGK